MKFFITRSAPVIALLLIVSGCSPEKPAPKSAPVIMNSPSKPGAVAVARETLANTVDPICDMALEEKVQHTAKHDGKTFGFCSDYCSKEFEKDPKKFIAKLEAASKK